MDIAAESDESRSLVRVAIWAGQNAHDPGLYSSTRPLFTKRLNLSRPLFGGGLYSRKYGTCADYTTLDKSIYDTSMLFVMLPTPQERSLRRAFHTITGSLFCVFNSLSLSLLPLHPRHYISSSQAPQLPRRMIRFIIKLMCRLTASN